MSEQRKSHRTSSANCSSVVDSISSIMSSARCSARIRKCKSAQIVAARSLDISFLSKLSLVRISLIPSLISLASVLALISREIYASCHNTSLKSCFAKRRVGTISRLRKFIIMEFDPLIAWRPKCLIRMVRGLHFDLNNSVLFLIVKSHDPNHKQTNRHFYG